WLAGSHTLSNPAAHCRRSFWSSFVSDGLVLRCNWPWLALHHRIHCRDRFLPGKPRDACACRPPSLVRAAVRRNGLRFYVLCGAATLRARAGSIQPGHLHHRPHRTPIVSWTAHSTLRPALRQLSTARDILAAAHLRSDANRKR